MKQTGYLLSQLTLFILFGGNVPLLWIVEEDIYFFHVGSFS
jgi:hypothetical protein